MNAEDFELDPLRPPPLVRLADGTIKQRNALTGTEVWTVPGRAHRPLPRQVINPQPLHEGDQTSFCNFCSDRYLATPPEKDRLVLRDGQFEHLSFVPANHLFDEVAEFRRIPNLFEIVSYDYWHLNYHHQPSEEMYRRMAEYLASPEGYDHVLKMLRLRLAANLGEAKVAKMREDEILTHATGLFAGGHDVIVARRHFVDGATDTSQLASCGTLSVDEHRAYTRFTVQTMQNLYQLNDSVKYVAAFQNWLKPAGASFDHLHKQLVCLDEYSVQIEDELNNLAINPQLYAQILHYVTYRSLLVAANEHAVAFADFGHRFPSIAIWPLGRPRRPWQYAREEMDGISDVLHAVHCATGPDIPCNEEWYHCPPDLDLDGRFRILVKWRISTLAGFEGGTRIYLNTIDPWSIRERLVQRLMQLRDQGKIANMELGAEIHLNPVRALGLNSLD